MSRAPVFAANWKMNNGPRAARLFIDRFCAAYPVRDDRTVIICPPALSLGAVVATLPARRDIAVGVQNIWTEERGAYTGENSASMAREAGALYALVGHSERRHLFGETNAQTAAKCAIAVENHLIPILCVGETLAEREGGRMTAVVVEQLLAGISGIAPDRARGLHVAYEPVWAIGTGKTATPLDASEMHGVIRSVLAERIGAAGETIPILYGGSVNAGNVGALLGAENVGGVLVGGASLDPLTWSEICRAEPV